MPRGRRRASIGADALEIELQQLKEREKQLRAQLRRLRGGGGSLRKLHEKAAKQFSNARWTASRIRELSPGWDEIAFYRSVEPRPPTPRRRRKQTDSG